MTQDILNTRSIELATKALAKIEQHEKTCTEREANHAQRYISIEHKIDSGHKEMKKDLEKLFSRAWTISGRIIFIALAIIGFLLVRMLF